MKRVLDDSLIYEILSAVECHIRPDRVSDRQREKRQTGGKGSQQSGILRKFSLSPGGKSCGKAGSWMDGAGGSAPAGRSADEGRHTCGFKKVQMGSLKTESASAGGGFSLYCLERTVGHDPVTAEICG